MFSPEAPHSSSLGEMAAQYQGPDAPLAENLVTVMIRNVPKRYTVEGLLIELSLRCRLEECCLLHLPCSKGDFNIGYAFVTFSTPEAAQTCFYAMSGQSWTSCKNSKQCRVVPARVQGVSANLEQYVQNLGGSRYLHSPYAPLVFSQGRRCGLMEAVKMYCGVSLYEEMRQKCFCEWDGHGVCAGPSAQVPGDEERCQKTCVDPTEEESSAPEHADLFVVSSRPSPSSDDFRCASSMHEVPLGSGSLLRFTGMVEGACSVTDVHGASPPWPIRLLK